MLINRGLFVKIGLKYTLKSFLPAEKLNIKIFFRVKKKNQKEKQ